MNTPFHFTFCKDEKLVSIKIMDSLFNSGRSFHSFPIRIAWKKTQLPHPVPFQIVFIVSKKNIKRAVDRNRIRRQMREVFRLHKNNLRQICLKKEMQLALALMFNAKNPLLFQELEHKIILLLHRLEETLMADDQ